MNANHVTGLIVLIPCLLILWRTWYIETKDDR